MITKQLDKTSRESRIFAQKVARSIIEVQPNVNNTADIIVLLECLGYRPETLKQYGFENFHDLANSIYDFLDVYEMRNKNKEIFLKSFTLEVPKTAKRIAEGIGMIFPWLGSLALLFTTGISLWMAWGLPIQITTAFVIGVFLGLVITEGTLQVFNRLFLFYHAQTNMGEMKRLIQRSYYLVGSAISVVVAVLFVIGYAEHIPPSLVAITTISTVTISLHRASYMVVFALKRLKTLIISYSAAFASLLSTYYLGQPLVQDSVTRYFVGLSVAFAVLSAFSIYEHHLLTSSMKKSMQVTKDKPHFYQPISKTDKTIKSRFGIQIWEAMPYSVYGTFFLVTMFADRILSWIYNPIVLGRGFGLPMAFNSVYHTGADMALVVLLPASIIQYVMMTPIHMHLNNISITIKVSQVDAIVKFMKDTYKRVKLVSILTAAITAAILNLVAPPLMANSGFSPVSIHVLQVASIANVFLSNFSANSLFMMLVNKIKQLSMIVIISSIIVVTCGVLFIGSGLQSLVFAYLASAVFAGLASEIYANKMIKKAGSAYFARLM